MSQNALHERLHQDAHEAAHVCKDKGLVEGLFGVVHPASLTVARRFIMLTTLTLRGWREKAAPGCQHANKKNTFVSNFTAALLRAAKLRRDKPDLVGNSSEQEDFKALRLLQCMQGR